MEGRKEAHAHHDGVRGERVPVDVEDGHGEAGHRPAVEWPLMTDLGSLGGRPLDVIPPASLLPTLHTEIHKESQSPHFPL